MQCVDEVVKVEQACFAEAVASCDLEADAYYTAMAEYDETEAMNYYAEGLEELLLDVVQS